MTLYSVHIHTRHGLLVESIHTNDRAEAMDALYRAKQAGLDVTFSDRSWTPDVRAA